MMASGTDTRDSSKRKVDTPEDLSGGEDSVTRLTKKARLRDELEFLQIRLRPKVTFRRPPSPPSVQQCENSQLFGPAQQRGEILHSSQSQIGDDRDNPLMLEDDEELDQHSESEVDIDRQDSTLGLENDEGLDKPSDSISATSKESEVDIDDQDNPSVLEDDEGPGQSSGSQVDTTSPTEGRDRRTSTPKRRQGQRDSVTHREEWEIEKIVGKRRTRRGYEYKVRWQDTWLLASELGHAQDLVQEFDKEWLSTAAKTSTGEDGQR